MQRFAFASAALAVVFSAAALAAPASVRVLGTAPDGSGVFRVQGMTVQYDDAEVATSDGAISVLARVGEAAKAVCTIRPVRASMADAIARCQKDAVKQAVAEVNAPALSLVAGVK